MTLIICKSATHLSNQGSEYRMCHEMHLGNMTLLLYVIYLCADLVFIQVYNLITSSVSPDTKLNTFIETEYPMLDPIGHYSFYLGFEPEAHTCICR